MRRIPSLLLASMVCFAAQGAEPTAANINLTPGAAPASSELIATLAEKDRQLFEAVFGCKLDLLASLIADDFEFVHDKWGQTADSGAKFMQGMRDNCKAQETGQNFRARRELVEGSMTVHVLNHYGAMQMGEHRFFALQPGQPDKLTESGKFIDVWRQIDGEWKLARVISYDHQLAE
ncbi:nuclear transport factor 2 family protein [Lysobacter hankyongensis]|uniref:Nuclear transport factor 2 family protein n=1 Tax=Lysobacter hankyongensis TaxID=1176535 RepID=A0ABP9AGH0_9GAMM